MYTQRENDKNEWKHHEKYSCKYELPKCSHKEALDKLKSNYDIAHKTTHL